MSICANIDGSYLVASINQVSAGKDLRFLQEFEEIKDDNCPAVVLQLKRNLSDESIRSGEVLEEITY